MPKRPKKPCSQPGCPNLVEAGTGGRCELHKRQADQEYDRRRGSSSQRGYTARWQRYSKRYLKQPDNVLCMLRLPGCNVVAQCVDHIDPPDGPNDPRFWDSKNHQPACIHCNSVKGHRYLKGERL